MKIQGKKLEYIIVLAIALIAAWFNWRISVGVFVGLLFSRIHMFTLSARMNSIIDSSLDNNKSPNVFLVYFGGLLDVIILMIPFVLAYCFPAVIHWIGLAIGLLYDKIYLYISSLLRKEG